MKVLVIGNGGREHALVWKISQSPRLSVLYCAPGNAGIEQIARCIPIQPDNIPALKAFAISEGIDLTVVGPETPLAKGIATEFRKSKLKIFGPTQGAAQIESSKAFAKELMLRHSIPTAAAKSFTNVGAAMEYVNQHAMPVVVKADGLAQGKGVVIASTPEEAQQTLVDILERQIFGEAGCRAVIEEYLEGEEVSVMAFTDGKNVVPMVAAQDHKRVGDADTGPNTGGMGAYAPAPIVTPALLSTVMKDILVPTVNALSQVGRPFQGVLYAGLMVVHGKPYVLEFNARFGDPETQVVLPLLKTDLLDVMEAVAEHRLEQCSVEWSDQAAVCVVLTSGGYPGSYKTGFPIQGLQDHVHSPDVLLFHAGTRSEGSEIVTAGGRVLGITSVAPALTSARDHAYEAVRQIVFEGRHFRTDIASRAVHAHR